MRKSIHKYQLSPSFIIRGCYTLLLFTSQWNAQELFPSSSQANLLDSATLFFFKEIKPFLFCPCIIAVWKTYDLDNFEELDDDLICDFLIAFWKLSLVIIVISM